MADLTKTTLAVVFLCVAAGCASRANFQPYTGVPPTFSSQAPSVSPQAQKDVLRAFIICIIQAEDQLDDHISDAQTIALGLSERCASAYATVTTSFDPGGGSRTRALWVEQRSTKEAKIEASLDTVLSMRKGYVFNASPEGPLLLPPGKH